MEPLNPEQREKILAGREYLEQTLNEYMQLLSERFSYDPSDKPQSVLEAQSKRLQELRDILFPGSI